VKRLVAGIAVLAVVLAVTSVIRGHDRTRTQPLPSRSTTNARVHGPEEIARRYLTALLTGDLTAARAVSTPLLAQQLSTVPAPQRAPATQPTLELTVLSAGPTDADVAASLHWPNGQVAALRVLLNQMDGRWHVAGVQP